MHSGTAMPVCQINRCAAGGYFSDAFTEVNLAERVGPGASTMRYGKIIGAVLIIMGPGLAGCATQQGMTVIDTGPVANSPKYRNAMAVRSVTGGQLMNAMTVMGVTNEPLKAALESSLATNGYLAGPGAAKYYIDAEITNLDEPVIGLDMDVTASVTYKVAGPG